VPIETIIFFVSWLALTILGTGLLLRGWEWLLVSGWGWLLARVIGFVFWLALATFVAGLFTAGWWWLALAIFGGGLYIRGWKAYVEREQREGSRGRLQRRSGPRASAAATPQTIPAASSTPSSSVPLPGNLRLAILEDRAHAAASPAAALH
jgi:hypothetical protein